MKHLAIVFRSLAETRSALLYSLGVVFRSLAQTRSALLYSLGVVFRSLAKTRSALLYSLGVVFRSLAETRSALLYSLGVVFRSLAETRSALLYSLAHLGFAACGTNLTPQPAPVPTLPDCVPNLDGMIVPAELPIALGATLDYYMGTNRTVDLVAVDNAWDFSVQSPTDAVVALGPVALEAQWYAANFPAGEFTVDAGGGLDGIYHQDDTALWLDGTASQDPAPTAGKTLIVYTEPVAVLRFPIVDGGAYSTTAALPSATIDGLPFIGTDQVDVDVTGTGELEVPYVDFAPVLRVRTHVVRTPSTGTPVVGKRTDSFLFECFGEVARAESNDNEPEADFTTAAVFRRFALGVTP